MQFLLPLCTLRPGPQRVSPLLPLISLLCLTLAIYIITAVLTKAWKPVGLFSNVFSCDLIKQVNGEMSWVKYLESLKMSALTLKWTFYSPSCFSTLLYSPLKQNALPHMLASPSSWFRSPREIVLHEPINHCSTNRRAAYQLISALQR